MYVGPLLPGFDDPWLAPHRTRCDLLFRSACSELIEQLVALGAPIDALSVARRLVLHDGADEEAHIAVVRLLASIGEIESALGYVEAYVRTRESAEVVPSGRMEELVATLRAGKVEAMGGGVRARSDARTLPPIDRLPFVDQAARVDMLLAQLPRSRVVTVTGVSGCGKSRVLREVVRAASPDWASAELRSWWVDGDDIGSSSPAASADDPEVVLADLVAVSVGAPPVLAGAAAFGSVVDVLSPSPAILVIDHADAPWAPWATFVNDLLAHCPHLRVICAARLPLGLRGEVVWRVPPLRTAPPRHAPRGTLSEAGELYAALGGRWPVPLPDREPASRAIDAWVAEADGLPLAVALLARESRRVGPPPDPALRDALWSREPSFPVEGARGVPAARRSADPLSPGVPARHATLAAAYERTLLELNPLVRQMLAILVTTPPPLNPATVQAAWKARAVVTGYDLADDLDDDEPDETPPPAPDADRPNFRRGIDDATWLEALIVLARCGLIDVQRTEGQPTTYCVRPGLRRYVVEGG